MADGSGSGGRHFRLPAGERRVVREVDEEISFHVEERTRELIAGGMEAEAARAAALREFGDVAEARRELEAIGRRRTRRSARVWWWSDLGQDIRFGARSAAGDPLFSLLAIVTLALGIGVNAAVFGVVKSVLLDSLPYADADRLVRVHGRFLDGSMERGALSAGSVVDIAERQRSLERVSAFASQSTDAVFGGDERPRVTSVVWVQPGFFETLGVAPAAGRTLVPEDVDPDTARVAVLTHAGWQRLFGGDPEVVGRQAWINGIPRTVVGVLPREFVTPTSPAEVFFALDLTATLNDPVSSRRSHWLAMIGRVAPGVSQEAARRDLTAIGSDLSREHPESTGSIGVAAMPLREAMAGDTRAPLLVLMASAGLVLLIACANLAGAHLSRSLTRRKEFAVRIALGARRGRVARQLLTETLLLSVIGGALGLALAWVGLSALGEVGVQALPPYADLSLDAGAVLVAAALTLLTGVAFGLAPALSAGQADPQGTLREEGRSGSEGPRSRRLRGLLVAGQIALCVSLLAAAGVLARSLVEMTRAPLGFEPGGVLHLSVQVPGRDYPTPQHSARLYEAFRERLEALPGVSSAAVASMPPTGVMSRMGVSIDGMQPAAVDAQPFVLYANVSDEYFRTLRIPLRQGRVFDERDHAEAPPVLVISESMAQRYWPGGGALGARVRLGPNPAAPLHEVVGIVGDVRNDPTQPGAEPMAYRSIRQDTWPIASFLARSEGDPVALLRAAELEMAALDPGLPFREAAPLSVRIGEGYAERRLPVLLMGAFGALALLLASVGVYALFASMAAAREREFGVRMALGSRPRAIAALVLRQGAVWMAAGTLGGVVGIALTVPLLRDLLFGVEPFDPLTLAGSLALLLTCAAVALLGPVRRATRVDPADALRAR